MIRAAPHLRGPATNRSKPAAVVLLSGGLDSAACIAFYQSQAFALTAVFFDYDQPALAQERKAARKVAGHFDIELHEIELSGLQKKGAGEVRGRNAVFMLMALMEHPIQQ